MAAQLDDHQLTTGASIVRDAQLASSRVALYACVSSARKTEEAIQRIRCIREDTARLEAHRRRVRIAANLNNEHPTLEKLLTGRQ